MPLPRLAHHQPRITPAPTASMPPDANHATPTPPFPLFTHQQLRAVGIGRGGSRQLLPLPPHLPPQGRGLQPPRAGKHSTRQLTPHALADIVAVSSAPLPLVSDNALAGVPACLPSASDTPPSAEGGDAAGQPLAVAGQPPGRVLIPMGRRPLLRKASPPSSTPNSTPSSTLSTPGSSGSLGGRGGAVSGQQLQQQLPGLGPIAAATGTSAPAPAPSLVSHGPGASSGARQRPRLSNSRATPAAAAAASATATTTAAAAAAAATATPIAAAASATATLATSSAVPEQLPGRLGGEPRLAAAAAAAAESEGEWVSPAAPSPRKNRPGPGPGLQWAGDAVNGSSSSSSWPADILGLGSSSSSRGDSSQYVSSSGNSGSSGPVSSEGLRRQAGLPTLRRLRALTPKQTLAGAAGAEAVGRAKPSVDAERSGEAVNKGSSRAEGGSSTKAATAATARTLKPQKVKAASWLSSWTGAGPADARAGGGGAGSSGRSSSGSVLSVAKGLAIGQVARRGGGEDAGPARPEPRLLLKEGQWQMEGYEEELQGGAMCKGGGQGEARRYTGVARMCVWGGQGVRMGEGEGQG